MPYTGEEETKDVNNESDDSESDDLDMMLQYHNLEVEIRNK